MGYGVDSSRYAENKRAVENKYIGALVKTSMNRCIQCTRCVRFTTEVAGVSELGAIGRGEDMEITTYLERALTSELQGNVVDLCPVGALTSKPTEFHARPWEYVKTESVDVMDALGSAIRVDSRGREVVRILPRVNEAINEEWISDKTRHIVDGLKTQRLDRPYVRVDGKLKPATWPQAFAAIAAKVKKTSAARIGAIAGDLASVEEMFALKALMDKLGVVNIDCRQDGSKLDPKFGRASYLFNPTIAGIEEADAIMIIGANPRLEAPVLNARIRKRWLKGDCLIGVIGEKADLTYAYNYLGAGPDSLAAFAEHPPADKAKPMFILGAGALARPDGAAVLGLAAKAALSLGVVKDGWNGFNVLQSAASRVGGLDLGLVPGQGGLDALAMAKAGALDVLFNLGADEIDIEPGAFVVYLGTHGDKGAHRADVILPGAAYTEKTGIYVNTEGRPQFAERAVFPPGEAREDWAILRALSEAIGAKLPFDSLGALRAALAARPSAISSRSIEIAPADAARVERARRPRRRARSRAVRLKRLRLLFHQPDRARFPRHGRVLGPGQGRHAAGGGIGRTMSSATPSRPAQSNGSSSPRSSRCWRSPSSSSRRSIGSSPAAPRRAFGAWMYASSLGAFVRYVLESLLLLVCVLRLDGGAHLRRAQDLGRDSHPARAERRRPLGRAAALRRFPQVHLQGADHPGGRQQGRVRHRAVGLGDARARGLGGHSRRRRLGGRRHQRRRALSLRRLLARRLRHHHGGLGVEFEIPVLVGAARGGADGVLRSLDRLRHRHRAAVRGLAELERHRARAGHAVRPVRLVLAAAAADVRHLLRLGARRDQPPAVRSGRGGVGAGRGIHGRIFGFAVPAASSSPSWSRS